MIRCCTSVPKEQQGNEPSSKKGRDAEGQKGRALSLPLDLLKECAENTGNTALGGIVRRRPAGRPERCLREPAL